MRTRVEPACYGSRPGSHHTDQCPSSRHVHRVFVGPQPQGKTAMTGDLMSCVKYFLLVVNAFFALVGILFLGVGLLLELGTMALGKLFEYHPVLSTVLYFELAMGAVLFLFSFVGVCGALRENRCLLLTYFSLIFCLVVAEISIGIFAVVKWETVNEEKFRTILQENFKHNKNDEFSKLFNVIMFLNNCCGSMGVDDFGGKVPTMCCPSTVNDTCPAETVYKKGCFNAVNDDYSIYMYIFGGLFLVVMISQIIAMSVSMCLFRGLRTM